MTYLLHKIVPVTSAKVPPCRIFIILGNRLISQCGDESMAESRSQGESMAEVSTGHSRVLHTWVAEVQAAGSWKCLERLQYPHIKILCIGTFVCLHQLPYQMISANHQSTSAAI